MSDNTSPDATPKGPPTARNPVTTARFRRESWWQIIFPVLVMTLLSVAAVVLLIVLGGPGGASIVADYSLILVIIPNLVIGLAAFLLLGGLAYLLTRLVGSIPPYANLAQEGMKQVYRQVDKVTNQIAGAVITVRSVMTGISIFLREQGITPDGDQANAEKQAQPKSPSES